MLAWWEESGKKLKRPFSAFTNWLEKTKPDASLMEKEWVVKKDLEWEVKYGNQELSSMRRSIIEKFTM
jgi:hypothetical protein